MLAPKNTSFVMTEIKGTRQEQRQKSMEWLDLWLSLEIKRGRHGCLIFDIDDTVIEENKNEEDKLIKPVSNLYKKYRDLGIPIYFVTARPDVRGNKKATETMLHKLGLGGYKGLFLMGKEYTGDRDDAVNNFKFNKRNEIYKLCGHIMARIGDMGWDSLPPPKTFKGDTKVLHEIHDSDCYIVFHPKLSEVSIKLPGRS
jgi:hypothetical protein